MPEAEDENPQSEFCSDGKEKTMNYLLGIDFGGGASKATLLRTDGAIVGEHTVEYPTAHPAAGACEQNPCDWMEALCRNTHAILRESGVAPERILAVALDSATHSSVVCDENFLPLRPCLHWTDSRSGRQSDELHRKYGQAIFEKTFHLPDTIWTLPQLLWLRETEPEIFGKIRHVFFEKDFIRYRCPHHRGSHDYLLRPSGRLFR